METIDYLKLKKKENKTQLEWELLKSVQALRAIGEIVTDATKGQMESDEAVKAIRERLME